MRIPCWRRSSGKPKCPGERYSLGGTAAKQPGNIPDVIAIGNAIEQLKCFDIGKPLVTTDTGYYSEANLRGLCRRNMKFLTLIDTDVSMARNAVDAMRETLNSMMAGDRVFGIRMP